VERIKQEQDDKEKKKKNAVVIQVVDSWRCRSGTDRNTLAAEIGHIMMSTIG